jgi:hypothetical protein
MLGFQEVEKLDMLLFENKSCSTKNAVDDAYRQRHFY